MILFTVVVYIFVPFHLLSLLILALSTDPVYIHPSSCLFHLLRKGLGSSGDNQKKKKLPESVVYADLLVTTKKYMRNLVVIDSKWLGEVAPHIYRNIKTTP